MEVRIDEEHRVEHQNFYGSVTYVNFETNAYSYQRRF